MNNIFFVVATSAEYQMPVKAPDGVADYIRLSDKACIALGEGIAPTSSDIATIFDLGPKSKETGIVVKVETYYGYEDSSIWEKLQTWQNRKKV